MRKTKRKIARHRAQGEAAIVERIEGTVAKTKIGQVRLHAGIGDDAALWTPRRGFETILTCDWFLEGTHFLREKHPPDAVGWKCLARAVSDVAAMGGMPRCFLLSLALPSTHTGFWLDQFLRGLRRAAGRFQCALAGGDTTRRRDILINVMVLGEVQTGQALLRSQARPGDVLFVSGRLGEAELGLRLIRESNRRLDSRDPVLRKHLYPEPRLTLGRWLSEKRLASAMMDLSDGLSADLPRLCAASAVGARVHAERIPAVRVPSRRRSGGANPLTLALHGGDDYELLFTVPRKKLKDVPDSFHGVPITAIGQITNERLLLFIDEVGHEVPLSNRGWDSFRERH